MSGSLLAKKLLPVAAILALATGTVLAATNAYADDHSPTTTIDKDDPNADIVGGGSVEEDRPWITALESKGSFTCTSSQVAAEWIITAAHCVDGGSDFTVRIGSLERSSGGTERTIDEVNVHPDFNWPANDIALLHLSQAYENSYAPMATAADVQLGQPATIYGWGSENPDWGGELPEHLKYAEGSTSQDQCDTEGVVCVVGNGGVAGGDSGGPAFIKSATSGEYVQVGVCAIGQKPTDGTWSGYTSIPDHADWVNETMA